MHTQQNNKYQPNDSGFEAVSRRFCARSRHKYAAMGASGKFRHTFMALERKDERYSAETIAKTLIFGSALKLGKKLSFQRGCCTRFEIYMHQ